MPVRDATGATKSPHATDSTRATHAPGSTDATRSTDECEMGYSDCLRHTLTRLYEFQRGWSRFMLLISAVG